MKLKKLFAALLAVVLLLSCMPLMASADEEPTVLYVGELNKSDDNLIKMLEARGRDKQVLVYAVDVNTRAYYTLTYEDGIGYVLTFYNDYCMSQIVEARGYYCGLYCDGDLTVRLAGNVTFDVNDTAFRNTVGWLVRGQLTIEKATKDEYGRKLPKETASSLIVNGSKANATTDDGSIGIKAETLMLNNVTVTACGGYAGVVASEALVMAHASLFANTAEDMFKDGKANFMYGVVTENFIQVEGLVRARGMVDIDGFYIVGGVHYFDYIPVVYNRDYTFCESSYSGAWSDSFKLFNDPDEYPSCMKTSVGSTVAKLGSNKVTLNRRGTTKMELTIRCGSELIIMDSREVKCRIMWWQWIPYILSGSWIDGLS